jgi:chorismate mutase
MIPSLPRAAARLRTAIAASTLVLTALPVDSLADGIDCLPRLMAERLTVMPDVAAYKWTHGLPIEDLSREAEILDRLAARDDLRGLSPDVVRAFFRAQIEAAKTIQRGLFEDWSRTPPALDAEGPDLARELRPSLDRLTEALIACLASASPELGSKASRTTLEAVPPQLADRADAWAIAVAPLLSWPND